ncbi:MAG: hypothetical protein P8P30_01530 [Rickettsiales bacterium]|nr:hypothetical protein [Rickettsiales bacterium]
MRKLCLIFTLFFITALLSVSLHAAEFGVDTHEHHGEECQLDDVLKQDASRDTAVKTLAMPVSTKLRLSDVGKNFKLSTIITMRHSEDL